MFSFEKFPVYIRSEELYVEVIKILRNPMIDRNTRDQFKRAALSISLNIAEGAGKFTKSDKKNFYVTAKGSVNECVSLLRLLKIENAVSEENFQKSYNDLLDIAKMLSGLIKSLRIN